jgi:predicted metalloprotease
LFSKPSGLGTVDCRLPVWHEDPSSAQAFYQAGITCLSTAWQPVLASFNLPFSPPKLFAPATGNGGGPCITNIGAVNSPAYYCGDTNTIYLPYQSMMTLSDLRNRPGAYLTILAHEFGHHVQAMAGILATEYHQAESVGPDSAAGLDLSRRLELQADCFGGMFMGKSYGHGDVGDDMWNDASYSNHGAGDQAGAPRTHGSDDHAYRWWKTGSDQVNTQACNTWVASSADVS